MKVALGLLSVILLEKGMSSCSEEYNALMMAHLGTI